MSFLLDVPPVDVNRSRCSCRLRPDRRKERRIDRFLSQNRSSAPPVQGARRRSLAVSFGLMTPLVEAIDNRWLRLLCAVNEMMCGFTPFVR